MIPVLPLYEESARSWWSMNEQLHKRLDFFMLVLVLNLLRLIGSSILALFYPFYLASYLKATSPVTFHNLVEVLRNSLLNIMSSDEDAGRIHNPVFVVSNLSSTTLKVNWPPKTTSSVFLGISLVSVCARFYIRFHVQKQRSIDDIFILFGTCSLIAAITLLHVFIDKRYMIEAMIFGVAHFRPSTNDVQQAFDLRIKVTIFLILSWCSICSVKFSFLFLFRRLIDRMRYMFVYWWVVTIFNVAVFGYGCAAAMVACPYFNKREACRSWYPIRLKFTWKISLMACLGKCFTGDVRWVTFNHAMAQMILDIVGDLLSKNLTSY